MKLNLSEKLSNAVWRSAVNVERPFVSYPNTHNSLGLIWHEKYKSSDAPVISIIIPTFDAFRDGYFPKLLDQISNQNFSQFEIIVVRSDPRQGRAINIGAALAKGKYLLTLDDDTALPDPETFSKLVAVMEKHPEIGMAGGNNVIPEDASPFVRRVMEQVPRYSWKPVQKITDSDLAQHGCMIIRTEDFKMVGGENELIPRGLDPYLREEFRKIGKRVVLVPEVIYHHLPPDSIRKLVFRLYRNGRQAAFANRNYPQWIIETPSKHGSFRNRLPLCMRIFRFPLRLLQALITIKPIWF
ncbi:MAG: glycosyltransferase, partial [Armatimonadetes bacterium]|nr:glycosyltransferase [Armatimonadota bacterium]